MMIMNISDEVVRVKTTLYEEIEIPPKDLLETKGILNLEEIRNKVVIISGSDDEFLS